jgi:hypothetical protein
MGMGKRKKGAPLSERPLFGLTLCCVPGLPIGPGALPALIASQLQRPICEHLWRFGSMSRETVPSPNTRHCGRGKFERSFRGGQSVEGGADCKCHREGKGDFEEGDGFHKISVLA